MYYYDTNKCSPITLITTPLHPIIPHNYMNIKLSLFIHAGRIDLQDSLLHYPPDTDYNTFNIQDFTPLFLEEVLGNMTEAERAEAEKTCGDNRECLFDFAVTGESSCRLPICTVELFQFSDKILLSKIPQHTICVHKILCAKIIV